VILQLVSGSPHSINHFAQMSAVGVFQDAQQGLLLFGSGGVGVSAGDGGDKGSGAAKSQNYKFRGKK
jgi:photosystem II stability/assembly factor-like uncharacterized protein